MCWVEATKIKKTRKVFRCNWCWTPIAQGGPCVRHRGITDGAFFTARLHPECSDDMADVLDYCDTYIPGDGERPFVGPRLNV